MTTLRDAALSYAARGWNVFPASRAKVPLVRDWPNVATIDAAQVRAWWKEWPQASVALATGRIVVLDVDGPDGIAAMNTLRAGHEWPTTLASTSGRSDGGVHMFFTAPEGVVIGNRDLAPKINVRGRGGQVVLPPSRHPSGSAYRWSVRAPMAPLPSWMVERLTWEPIAPSPVAASAPSGYGRAALEGEVRNIRNAADGELNRTLYRAAYKLGRFVASGALDEDDVRDALIEAAVDGGHPARGASRTVNSGLASGTR